MEKNKRKRQHRTYDVYASGLNYSAVEDGIRSFVVAQDNREEGYQIGDIINLVKVSDGRPIGGSIECILKSYQKCGKGLMRGWLVLELETCIRSGKKE